MDRSEGEGSRPSAAAPLVLLWGPPPSVGHQEGIFWTAEGGGPHRHSRNTGPYGGLPHNPVGADTVRPSACFRTACYVVGAAVLSGPPAAAALRGQMGTSAPTAVSNAAAQPRRARALPLPPYRGTALCLGFFCLVTKETAAARSGKILPLMTAY